MFNRGFGGVGGMGVPGSTDGFAQMAQHYWGAWEQALRGVVPGKPAASVPPGGQAWQEALQCWTDVFAHRPATGDVMARFGQQARQWYAQMQQVAAQFGGRGASPADITEAWRSALGGAAVNPFQHLLDSMNGPGMHGMEHWLRSVQPVLDALTGEGRSWLSTPAFGFAREHQERLQALTAAQLDVQQAGKAYQEVMLHASQAAFARFEQRLSALAAEGHKIDTPRALFDVWVDAAEEAYAEVALSEQYRHAYGNLLNAQVRLRAGIQREVEQFCAQLGMPTRSELDGAHRKIVALERELRRMQEAMTVAANPAPVAASTPVATPAPAASVPAVPPRKAAKPLAARNADIPSTPAPAAKPAVKKAPAKNAPARTATKAVKPKTSTVSKSTTTKARTTP